MLQKQKLKKKKHIRCTHANPKKYLCWIVYLEEDLLMSVTVSDTTPVGRSGIHLIATGNSQIKKNLITAWESDLMFTPMTQSNYTVKIRF